MLELVDVTKRSQHGRCLQRFGDHTVSSILCPFSKDKTHLRIVNQQDSGEHKAVVSKKTPTLAI